VIAVKVVWRDEFKKDFNLLSRKYRTLKEDLEIFIRTSLKLSHELNRPNPGIVRLANLGVENPRIYKARKFACRSLKGTGSHSGIRVIYAFYEETRTVELIEIYYKGRKENEDRNRILRLYKK
jgi:mRNA-degrading endonuclease RelE of RelBE toxin-antitoxin system